MCCRNAFGCVGDVLSECIRLWESGGVPPITEREVEKARRVVAGQARDAEELRVFLRMLGIERGKAQL